jgi:hypothetical protein
MPDAYGINQLQFQHFLPSLSRYARAIVNKETPVSSNMSIFNETHRGYLSRGDEKSLNEPQNLKHKVVNINMFHGLD